MRFKNAYFTHVAHFPVFMRFLAVTCQCRLKSSCITFLFRKDHSLIVMMQHVAKDLKLPEYSISFNVSFLVKITLTSNR